MSGSGGGSGGSGTQKYEWNDSMAPFWGKALEDAKVLTQNWQMTPYQGQRIADLNGDQRNSINNTREFLYQLNNPAGAINSSITQTQKTLDGDYLKGKDVDPYAAATNAYQGENPYFRQMMQQGQDDIISKYREVTKPDADAAAVLNGTLGGGDYQRLRAKNEEGLAKQIGQYTAGMQNEHYNRSAGLDESRLNRASGAFQNERGRMTGTIGLGQGLQGQAAQRAQMEMGIGDIQRAYSQDLLNNAYTQWQEQQQSPYKQLDYMTGILSRAQGGMAPNQTTTAPGYAASPYSQILGGLLGAYAVSK